MALVIEERVLPRWPYRLPRSSGGDGIVRLHGNVLERLLHVGPTPVRVRGWRTRDGYVHVRAESVDPAEVEHPIAVAGGPPPAERASAGEPELEIAVERMRFSLAVEDEAQDLQRRALHEDRHPLGAVHDEGAVLLENQSGFQVTQRGRMDHGKAPDPPAPVLLDPHALRDGPIARHGREYSFSRTRHTSLSGDWDTFETVTIDRARRHGPSYSPRPCAIESSLPT